MATPKKTNGSAVNFGDLSMYAAGGGLPEGDYIWKDLTVQMYQAQNQQGVPQGPPRLGVMITLKSLHNAAEEDRTQFYSMGSNADKSFAPNPETGKTLVVVPGGPGSTLNSSTNWAILLQSLYDSGLPQGIFLDDVSVLEGMHVHMANVPEPAERAGFQSKTSEVQNERRSNTIAVVTEIKEDGRPWEGTGGVTVAAPATAKPGPKAVAKPVAKALSPAKTVAMVEDTDVQGAAIQGIADVLEANADGLNRLKLKTGVFSSIKSKVGDEMAQAVMSEFFTSDEALSTVLGSLGYQIVGTGPAAKIQPAA